MLELIALIATGAAAVGGFTATRNFVRSRLRYVDRARTPAAPLMAGAAATVVALPVVGLLPLIGAGTAVIFGTAVGMGTFAGAQSLRKEDAGY